MVNYEVKGQLAKLLATEDLVIENRQVSTASFDVDKRVLTLPLWERASNVVYDLLVGHEVGHALFTPNEDWTVKYPNVPKSFVNVIEDVRIERLMKQSSLDSLGLSSMDIEILTLKTSLVSRVKTLTF